MSSLAQYLPYLAVFAAVGCGLMAGLLFAFSNFVMRALQQLPPAHGMEAMQRINVTIINPIFLLIFVGTAVLCLAISLLSGAAISQAGHAWYLAGSICYLAGVIGITAAFNVPLNNRLAKAPLSSASDVWPTYVAAWLLWNHLRSGMGVLALLFFAIGLLRHSNQTL